MSLTYPLKFRLCDEDLKAEVLEEKEQTLFSHSEKLAVCFSQKATGGLNAGQPRFVKTEEGLVSTGSSLGYFIVIFRQPLEPKGHDLNNNSPLREENEVCQPSTVHSHHHVN
ncbi:hypothetical protein AKJ16_DCAP09006 [Drosera capensis]